MRKIDVEEEEDDDDDAEDNGEDGVMVVVMVPAGLLIVDGDERHRLENIGGEDDVDADNELLDSIDAGGGGAGSGGRDGGE